MNDIANIRLSKDANDIAERLVATGKFENVVTAAKFALAYALKNYFDECDPSTYSIPDSSGSNYNVGSFDNETGEIMPEFPPQFICDATVCLRKEDE